MRSNPFTLENKHILITGASSGIGRQCAISCSHMGANITLVARNQERLDETLSLMYGEKHIVITQDISITEHIKGVVNESVLKLGKIDGFVHAAGIIDVLPLKLHTREVVENLMNVNFFSGLEFVRIISLKRYIVKEGASLVFISSVMSEVAQAGQIGYCATKGAIVSAVKSMAVELAKRNIRVNAVSPGQVADTEITEALPFSKEALEWNKSSHLLGWLHSEDVANSVIFLLSNGARKITGTNLLVDGGYCAK